MNVAKITMDPAAAREKLRAFRAEKHKDAEEFYRSCEAGYQALAAGTPLINLGQAILGAGFDDKMRPRLAIARADRREVYFRWSARSKTATFDTRANRSLPSDTLVVWVDLERLHGQQGHNKSWGHYNIDVEGFAQVPGVPADVRPATGHLKDWYVLWEVEQWAASSHLAKPDVDPYLLKHLGGELYAVLAEWDLTELERAVLGGAMRR